MEAPTPLTHGSGQLANTFESTLDFRQVRPCVSGRKKTDLRYAKQSSCTNLSLKKKIINYGDDICKIKPFVWRADHKKAPATLFFCGRLVKLETRGALTLVTESGHSTCGP